MEASDQSVPMDQMETQVMTEGVATFSLGVDPDVRLCGT